MARTELLGSLYDSTSLLCGFKFMHSDYPWPVLPSRVFHLCLHDFRHAFNFGCARTKHHFLSRCWPSGIVRRTSTTPVAKRLRPAATGNPETWPEMAVGGNFSRAAGWVASQPSCADKCCGNEPFCNKRVALQAISTISRLARLAWLVRCCCGESFRPRKLHILLHSFTFLKM